MSGISLSQEEIESIKKDNFLTILQSADELRDWIKVYLGLELPFTNVSQYTEDKVGDIIYGSPGQAIWEAYETYKNDLYKERPGFIWLASRDGAKTISGSILNVLLIAHFKAEIAHLAAVKKQAEKCIEYTNIFMRKIKPYLEHHGRKIITDSKSKIQVLNEDQSVSFIDVIVASLAGGNSQRAHVGSYDELDTLSKQGLVGYKESKLIPTRKNNHGPMTVKYSTRKFSFGVFEKEIQNRSESGELLVQWNILDITEKCKDERSKKDTGNTHVRWVKKQLPFKLYTEDEFEKMGPIEQKETRKIEIFDGCLKCPLASVCQGHLAKRPDTDVCAPGSIFKSVDFTIGQFKKTEIEMAESQLLCWKPTTIGLVYPKFSAALGDNVITLGQAYELIEGEVSENEVTLENLVALLHKHEAKIVAGVDFGYTHDSTIVIMALLKTGYSIVLDTFGQPGLEAHEFAEIAEQYNERYKVNKWFCDQASPASIKTFKKKGLNCPEFKKDVLAGIDAIRGQVITTTGVRKMKVLNTKENESLIKMFLEHHFLLDVAGNVTTKPDDDIGIADRADALRYIGQNVFESKTGKILIAGAEPGKQSLPANATPDQINQNIMKQQIYQRVAPGAGTGKTKKKGGFSWNI